MLRVLFVTNMWPDRERPWYGTFVHAQARSLQSLGVDVSVHAIPGYRSRSAYLAAIPAVARRVRANAYDIVHAHYGHSGVVARFQARAPLVVSYCGDDLLGTRRPDGSITPRSRLEAAAFRNLARLATATITKSEEMARTLPPSARGRNRVIPNGVDLERFRRIDRGAARQQLDWPNDQPVALFVGNPDIVSKNYGLAEEVVRTASARVPGLRLRIVWGVAPDQVPTMLSAADALLVTSASEGSPNAVKEAMAAELPIVSTSVGDIAERLSGLPGCQVRPADPEELAEGLVEALASGRVAEARRAVEPLSLERVAARVLDVYQEALSRRDARPSDRRILEGTAS